MGSCLWRGSPSRGSPPQRINGVEKAQHRLPKFPSRTIRSMHLFSPARPALRSSLSRTPQFNARGSYIYNKQAQKSYRVGRRLFGAVEEV